MRTFFAVVLSLVACDVATAQDKIDKFFDSEKIRKYAESVKELGFTDTTIDGLRVIAGNYFTLFPMDEKMETFCVAWVPIRDGTRMPLKTVTRIASENVGVYMAFNVSGSGADATDGQHLFMTMRDNPSLEESKYAGLTAIRVKEDVVMFTKGGEPIVTILRTVKKKMARVEIDGSDPVVKYPKAAFQVLSAAPDKPVDPEPVPEPIAPKPKRKAGSDIYNRFCDFVEGESSGYTIGSDGPHHTIARASNKPVSVMLIEASKGPSTIKIIANRSWVSSHSDSFNEICSQWFTFLDMNLKSETITMLEQAVRKRSVESVVLPWKNAAGLKCYVDGGELIVEVKPRR